MPYEIWQWHIEFITNHCGLYAAVAAPEFSPRFNAGEAVEKLRDARAPQLNSSAATAAEGL